MSDERVLAELEFEHGNDVTAAKFASYCIAKNPDFFASWDLLGRASLKIGWSQEGIDALENAALLKPLSTESRIELAIAYGSMGYERLSTDLLMMVALSGECTPASSLRVAVGLDLLGQANLAVEACRIAGRMTPNSAELQHEMAAYLLKSGRPANLAETLLRSAVSLEPGNISYRISLASLLSKLGRQSEAIGWGRDTCSEQLDSVHCSCCLKRLAVLFFDSGEMELAKLCAVRSAFLKDSPRTEKSKRQ